MAETPGARRLAAILAADVAGYSRLMHEDEDATVAAWRSARCDAIEPTIARHGGHLVKQTGDGFLAEFRAVTDAVRCAVEMQQSLLSNPLEFRMGVNLGDVIDDGGDIHGDGVNIAARLEALAEPGGVCVSAMVRDSVARKLNLEFKDIGEKEVKNIATPVRAYAVRAAPAAGRGAEPEVEDKPSIVVLPFENMSDDREQEYFADGLTEDLITELSRFHGLFVISRTSAFTYRNKALRLTDIARELGVRYVLEGSVRRAGSRLRVTVQLIDARSDRHIWADRYDRQLEDIFDIQDEVTAAIAATLPGRIEADRHDRARRKQTDNMAAYELVLAGRVHHHRSTREDNARAQELLDRAIALDPGYAQAHAWRACVLGQAWVNGWCADPEAVQARIVAALQTALGLDENDSDVHRILAAINITFDDLEKAAYHQERALALNPNDDLIVVQQGELLTWLGRAEEGIEWIRKAMRLNPYHPQRFWSHLGRAYFVAGRYQEAVEAFKRLTEPDHAHHAFLAACHAALGDTAGAAAHVRQVLAREPGFSVGAYLATLHYRDAEGRERHRAALLAVGLPA